MTSLDVNSVMAKSNNAEIYFETKDFDSFLDKIKKTAYEIEFIHDPLKKPYAYLNIRNRSLERV